MRRFFWFAGVGGVTTLAYAALAWLLTVHLAWWPALGSGLAYAVCAAGSFAGHKLLTFRSGAPLGNELPRFAASSLVGYGLAYGVPFILTQTLHLDARIAIAVVCVVCPAVNFVLLDSFVFRRAASVAPPR